MTLYSPLLGNMKKGLDYTCPICNKTYHSDTAKTPKEIEGIYKTRVKEEYICQECEDKYHLQHDYAKRGTKYTGSLEILGDNSLGQCSVGIELEVGGSIRNIKRVYELLEQSQEGNAAYDASLNGSKFELIFRPMTQDYLEYQSIIHEVVDILKNDPWTEIPPYTEQAQVSVAALQFHIQNPNIPARAVFERVKKLSTSIEAYPFKQIMEAVGRRKLGFYTRFDYSQKRAHKLEQADYHHTAISYSIPWDTIEFRFFKTSYDWDYIVKCMKLCIELYTFIYLYDRPIQNLSGETKLFIIDCIKNSRVENKEALIEYVKEIR